MVCNQIDQHPKGETTTKAMNILPNKLATTNDQLTSRAGLLTIAQLINTLKLSKRFDQAFPLPKSNRGFKPSQFIQTLILMQHEGSFHLDDVCHLEDESPLMAVLGIKTIPKADSIGAWVKSHPFNQLGSQLIKCS